MTKQEILQNLEKSKERMENSNKFNLADALAITDALIYLVQGDEITIGFDLTDGRQLTQAFRQAGAGRERTNGLRH